MKDMSSRYIAWWEYAGDIDGCSVPLLYALGKKWDGRVKYYEAYGMGFKLHQDDVNADWQGLEEQIWSMKKGLS